MRNKILAAIHIKKAELSLSDETYRELLHSRYGVRSAKDLDPDQHQDLLDFFKNLLAAPKAKRSPCRWCMSDTPKRIVPPGVVYPVSPRQLSAIKRLKEDILWRKEGGFEAWLWRYFSLKPDQIRASIQASQVISALKGLWRSQRGCQCSLARRARTNKKEKSQ